MRTRSLLLAAIALWLGATASSAHADLFLKHKHHTDAMQIMGRAQPAQDLIQSIWMTQDKVRSDDEKQSLILRLDRGVVYILDHTQKTYVEMPLDMGRAVAEAVDDKEMTEEERAGFEMFAQRFMKLEITVTETNERKRIGTWDCRKYVQTVQAGMMNGTSQIWATQDLKLDYDLFARLSAALLATQPGLGPWLEKATQEMAKIKGVPVLTTSTTQVMGQTMTSSQELVEFKEAKAPSGVFELPAGYLKQEQSAPAPPQLGPPGPPGGN